MSGPPNSEDRELGALLRGARDRRDAVEHEHEHDPVYGAFSEAEQDALAREVLVGLGLSSPEERDVARVLPLRGAHSARTHIAAARPPHRRARAVAALAGLAAMAAAVWLVLLPGPAPLPSYTLVPPASDASVRASDTTGSVPASVVSFAIGRELELVLRPSTSTVSRPQVASFVRRGPRLMRFVPAVERSESGALSLHAKTGPGAILDLPAGNWELVFLLYADEALSPEQVDPETPPSDAQRLTFRLRLHD